MLFYTNSKLLENIMTVFLVSENIKIPININEHKKYIFINKHHIITIPCCIFSKACYMALLEIMRVI